MPVCRLLPYEVHYGPHNMAADEALLHAAAAGAAAFRCYGWAAATVSLGYFQPARVCDTDLTELPCVRRPTGGAALVHHHELTYALALPAGRPWHGGEPWLCRMHAVIRTALRQLGLPAEGCPAERPPPPGSGLCFQHFTPGDVLLGGAKVVGSAQRRQRQALLQHGAILLAASPHTPALPGLAELVGTAPDCLDLRAAVAAELAAATGWDVTAADWTAAERAHIAVLTTAKYTQDWWNRKR